MDKKRIVVLNCYDYNQDYLKLYKCCCFNTTMVKVGITCDGRINEVYLTPKQAHILAYELLKM